MKTVQDIIEEAEVAHPRIDGQSLSDTYRMMENRQKWMIAHYGEMPWLNDED